MVFSVGVNFSSFPLHRASVRDGSGRFWFLVLGSGPVPVLIPQTDRQHGMIWPNHKNRAYIYTVCVIISEDILSLTKKTTSPFLGTFDFFALA
jgi:hypothetical protein